MRYYKNIYVNYLFTFIKNLNLTQGIWMLYLASRGLSLFEIGLLEGVFHVASMIMETPTGAVADIFGRKISRLIGVVLSAFSSVLMILSGSFIMFAVSFVVSAASYNFESGADEALVYDSLLIEKKQDKYFKIAGKNEVVLQAAGIAALAIGGIVGDIKYIYVYYLAIAISIAAFIVGAFFREPVIDGSSQRKGLAAALKDQYVESFRAVKGNGRLLYLILFMSVLSASVTLSFYYIQIAWSAEKFSVLEIGLFLSATSIAAAAGAFFADRIERRLGEMFILKMTPVIIALSVAAQYFTSWALLPLCVMNAFEAAVFVATRVYINGMIPSAQRATILSFESLMFSVVMILIFPLFGAVSDKIGMANSFLILGGVMLALSMGNIRLAARRPSAEDSEE